MKTYEWTLVTTRTWKDGGSRTQVLESGPLSRADMIEHLISILHEAGHHCCDHDDDEDDDEEADFDPSQWDRKMSLV